MRPYDALVIGAGPAGATAALLLARAGWSVAIAESSAFPRAKVCGEYMSPGTWALLRALGIEKSVAALAGPEIRRVAVYAGDRTLCADMPRCAVRGLPYGRAVSRRALDALLLAHALLAGAELWQPWRATALRGTPGEYECDVFREKDTRTLHARCVIAAHGSWRHGSLPTETDRQPHRPDDLLAFKAFFTQAALPRDLMPLVAFPGGYGGLVHARDRRVGFSCCVRRDALSACRGRYAGVSAGDALLAHLCSINRGLRDVIGPAHRMGPWLATGPVHPGVRGTGEAGLYLAGNAAGEAHPVVAEGISMAMQSATLLYGALCDSEPRSDWSAAATAYSRAWRSAFLPRLRISACCARMAMQPSLASIAARLLTAVPGLMTLGARWSGKAYRWAEA